MTGEMFRTRAGIQMTFIPYPGAPQGLQDVIGGRVSAMVEGLAAFTGAIASNSVKPLAVTSPQRLPNMPNLPTVAETIPGFNSSGWLVMLARPACRMTWFTRSTRTCARCSTFRR